MRLSHQFGPSVCPQLELGDKMVQICKQNRPRAAPTCRSARPSAPPSAGRRTSATAALAHPAPPDAPFSRHAQGYVISADRSLQRSARVAPFCRGRGLAGSRARGVARGAGDPPARQQPLPASTRLAFWPPSAQEAANEPPARLIMVVGALEGCKLGPPTGRRPARIRASPRGPTRSLDTSARCSAPACLGRRARREDSFACQSGAHTSAQVYSRPAQSR